LQPNAAQYRLDFPTFSDILFCCELSRKTIASADRHSNITRNFGVLGIRGGARMYTIVGEERAHSYSVVEAKCMGKSERMLLT
jgi:hypothetical protein